MKLFTRRELLIGGGVLAVLAALVPRLMDGMEASRAARVQTETRDWASTQSPRRAVSIAANEAAVLEDLRKVIAGQAAYRAVNHGFYDGRLDCLVSPQQCIPFYPPNAPTFLDRRLASLGTDSGYRRSFTAGSGPAPIPGEVSATSVNTYRYDAWPRMVGHDGVRAFAAGPSLPLIPGDASSSSVTTYRYDAWPWVFGHSGVRAFAADATGRICFTSGGTPVSQVSEGELEPSCTSLELFEPKMPSGAPTAPPTP